jgi:hypothetical protein
MSSPSAAPVKVAPTPAVFLLALTEDNPDLTVDQVCALVADLAGTVEFPNDRDDLLGVLGRLTAAAEVFAALEAAAHQVIAAAVWHGQKVMPVAGHGKVTQDHMAVPLGVSGPRVNAIMKKAAERFTLPDGA